MDNVSIEIDQATLVETYKRLTMLSKNTANKYARASARAAGRVIRTKARERARGMGLDAKGVHMGLSGHTYERTGRIPSNITFGSRKFRGYEATAFITWRTLTRSQMPTRGDGKIHCSADIRNARNNAWYERFVELGVPSRGIPARPFLRQAINDGAKEAVEAATKVVADGCDKEAALLGRSPVR